MRKEPDIQIQKALRVSNKMNLKRHIKRHIIIKVLKVKQETILKSAKNKKNCYKENLIRLPNFLTETLQARKVGYI